MTEESLSSNGSASDDMLTAPWLYLLSKEKNKKDLVQLRQRSGSWASIQEHNYPVSYPYVSSFVAGQIAQFFKKSLSYRLL
ncbi:hypothetical protein FJ364_05880 [Candidatus Dependentiae bacterium]|nr:hypothetical protein [Candidatus Dependentiae bacterium]